MVPIETIERAPSPGGDLVLYRRGRDYSLRIAGVELMNSDNHGSEDALGRITCGLLRDIPRPDVLVGGLGLGFTLRTALDTLPSQARVDVVEIVPEVVRWNRTILAPLANHPLEDPRVEVIEDDVARVIERSPGVYHGIMLDVDNGPDGLSRGNTALYRRTGLAVIRRALVPGGILAVWSSFESRTFTASLREVGFVVEVRTIRPRFRNGPRHYIWVCRVPVPRRAHAGR